MFFEILIAIIIGVNAGVITGLIPGIHINLISILLISVSGYLLGFTNPVVLCCFIVAMSVTHTFLDAIPSIFLGAPDSDQALNALPGHKLLLEGKGFEAVKLTVIGSLFCLIAALFIAPVMIPFSLYVYPLIKNYIGHILVVIILFMIFKDKNWLMNLFVFLFSGILGLIVLNISGLENPLFPLLSGLFGVSMLIISLMQKVNIPVQSFEETLYVPKKNIFKAICGGTIAGSLTGFFPGLGPAQGAVLATQVVKDIGDYGFMILVGGINTVNFVLSLITLYAIEKARNGAVIAISQLVPTVNIGSVLVFMSVALIVGGIASILALKISKVFALAMSKVSYEKVIIGVILLILLLVAVMSGWVGVVILFTSTAVGMLTGLLNISRNHQMGCLLLPVVLFFLL